MKDRNFRFDINGLRAWAVSAVVLFHFGIPQVTGGFVGVDIFFVISGYLMTEIIVSRLESDSFSLIDFYIARARRIIPALLALTIILLFIGWFWLPTFDYNQLGNHAFASVLFLSNFVYWRESGYFDAASHEKWLLHTWSLSTEWQFYLILPVVLGLAWRLWGKKGALYALVLGLLLSLALSLAAFTLSRWSVASFYLLPTRAWEMLAGALVWWVYRNGIFTTIRPRALEATGFILILLAIITSSPDDFWPSDKTLLPVVGTMLVLLANNQQSIFTNNAIAQWLGSRSYSIYLWHWPLCVGLHFLAHQENLAWIVPAIAVSVVLGHFSYSYIEQPFRGAFRSSSTYVNFIKIGLGVASVSVAASAIANLKVDSRIPAHIDLIANEARNRSPNHEFCLKGAGVQPAGCVYGGSSIGAIVIGDSHADASVTAVQAALPDSELGVLGWTYTGCATIIGGTWLWDQDGTRQCAMFNEWALQSASTYDSKVPVIIINRATALVFGTPEDRADGDSTPLVHFSQPYSEATPEYLEEFSQHIVDTACSWASQRTVYMVRPLPEMPRHVPKTMSRNLILGREADDISVSLSEYHERHRVVWNAQNEAATRCGVKLLNPLPYLCSDGQCWASKDSRPLYYDTNHLSEFGNKLLVPMFRDVFESHLATNAESAVTQ